MTFEPIWSSRLGVGDTNLKSVARGRWGQSRRSDTLFGNVGIHSEDRVGRAEKVFFSTRIGLPSLKSIIFCERGAIFSRMQLLHVVRFNGAWYMSVH